MLLLGRSLTQRHEGTKCVRYLCVLLLFASFLVLGCEQEPEDEYPKTELDRNLMGIWTSTAADCYTISSTHLSYGYGADSIEYAGTIRHAIAFSSTAGVIIIEYDADKKASYPIYDGNWSPTGEYHPLKGDFIGVYYQELKPGVSVKMSGSYIEGGAEEPTLDAAKAAFTLDKEGDYIIHYGTYTK